MGEKLGVYKIKKRSLGFSLVELLVSIAVAGVLVSLAMPAYQQFVSETRLTTHSNEFLSMLMLARSEAVKRNTRVTVCKSKDGLACIKEGSWEQGWIIFVDGASLGDVDDDDTILRVHGAIAQNVAMVGNARVADYISYVGNGRTQMFSGAMQGGTFTIHDAALFAQKKTSNCVSSSDKFKVSVRKAVITLTTGRARIDKMEETFTCGS